MKALEKNPLKSEIVVTEFGGTPGRSLWGPRAGSMEIHWGPMCPLGDQLAPGAPRIFFILKRLIFWADLQGMLPGDTWGPGVIFYLSYHSLGPQMTWGLGVPF